MEVTQFTEEVYHLVENLKGEIEGKMFSDIVDDDGHQYVDLVMEGGGVLGIALVGFTYVLEQAGIRFMQIGGASAGAINALTLAALGRPADAKSEKILKELADVDMYSFVDGDGDAKDLIEAWLKYGSRNFAGKEGFHGFVDKIFNKVGKAYIYSQGAQVWDNIRDDLGLNPGEVFRQWIEGILDKEKIKTTADLHKRLNDLPKSLRHRHGESVEDVKPMLALIAADVSTQTKAIFPKMAELYWKNPDAVNPSHYVRASMSIPIFFQPMRVENIPHGTKAMGCWKKHADYEQTLPESCTFIDGGIMSNFPINLFHRPDRVPNAPTFGVKLGVDERKTASIETPLTLLSVIFDSARFNLDSDFIARNPDYRKLVSCIGTGNHNWLNFDLSDAEKIDLFKRGAEEAARFLGKFDWEEYKNIRRGIAQAVKRANIPEALVFGDAVPNAIKTTMTTEDAKKFD